MPTEAPHFASPVLRRLIVALLILGTPVQAEIPQPDHVFYGTASRDGELVLAGEVSVVLDGQALPADRFVLGSAAAYGDRWVLRVPIDSGGPRSPGAGRPGDVAHLFLDGEQVATVEIGEPGEVRAVDLDPFFDDTTPPDPPGLTITSHQPGVWSSDPVIAVEWSGAADSGGAGLAGYSFVFDAAPDTQPDVELELLHEAGVETYRAASGPRPDGSSHRFHLRACDRADNCGAAVSAGPFSIDTTPPAPPAGLASTSHEPGVAIRQDVLEMAWTPAVDAGSGVDGYGYAVDASPGGSCGQVRDLDAATTTVAVGPLAGGSWYFHLCAVDRLGHWSAVAGAGPYVLEDGPPFVTRVGTVSATATDGLADGAAAAHGITQLLVTFSKAMNDLGLDGAPDDVTNPANYRLVEAGAGGTLETASCSDLSAEDRPLAFRAVSYHSATSTAALKLEGGGSLLAGRYRLLACGGLADTFGNGLDGDRDGVAGDAFRLDFEVRADNLVENPNFDDGLDSWSPAADTAAEISFDGEDADGAFSSGSAWLENLTGPGQVLVLSQCVDLPDVAVPYRLAGRVRNTMPPAAGAASAAVSTYFEGGSCSGAELGDQITLITGSTGGAWLPFQVFSRIPAGTRSVRLALSLTAGSGPDFGATAHFDNLVFQPDLYVLFADGFESGDLSEWSASVP